LNNITLSKITAPVSDELKLFNEQFHAALKSKTALVDLVAKYILKQKGKKIRPLLVLLSAKVAGGVTDRSYRGAILVELLHTATLVHDDVVDNADKRRGFPSINAVWKNKVAVLIGDYLLARGLMVSVNSDDFDFLKVMTNTVKRMSEGELLQISKTRKLDIDEETYFRIISDKTASLLSTCCEIGARSGTDDENAIKAMSDFGEYLGIAFQIRDDILDYVGSAKLFGKSLGADIKEKKITLPLIHALRSVDPAEAKRILKLVKKGNKKDNVEEVIKFVVGNGGIVESERVAANYIHKAERLLDIFPASENKAALLSLLDFIVNRKK